MPEIEFLGLLDEADDRPRRRAAWFGDHRRAIAPLLWAGAAAAAVVAPFASIYSVTFTNGIVVQSVDGWGRIGSSDIGDVTGHGARYGVVVVLAAAGLVAAAVLALLPRTGDTRLPGSVALVSGGVLAGALAEVYLVADNIRYLAEASDVGGGDRLRVKVGAMFWWGLASIALTIAGLVIRRPRRTEPDTAADDEPVEPPDHPEDESLPA